MQFVCVNDGDPNMDYLSKDAAKAYVTMTHEQYYKRFPQYFGTTITETFFDEPTPLPGQRTGLDPLFQR